jgi:aminoglycoside phosphotransferase (APT) family kinase protein
VLDLSASGVVSYLLDRKLIRPRAIVDGGLRVEDVSRSNPVFIVTAEGERCYAVKLAGTAGVAREAAVLERLRAHGPDLAAYLPTVVVHDEAAGVLVLETAPDARDLRAHSAGGRFSRALAREAGAALARLHAVPPDALEGLHPVRHRERTALLHRPDLDSLHTLSAAAVELTRIVQGLDELCAGLDDLLAGWSDVSVIHGDVRWDNCLALRRGQSRRWSQLQLIDWELCGAGDPGLDVGTFLGEYLRAWAQSVPIADARNPGRLIAHARLPLRRMPPALRAFWDAYVLQSGVAAAESGRILLRAARFAAVRLLSAGLEEAQALSEPRGAVLQLLPLSRNVLERPREAADLLGLGGRPAVA